MGGEPGAPRRAAELTQAHVRQQVRPLQLECHVVALGALGVQPGADPFLRFEAGRRTRPTDSVTPLGKRYEMASSPSKYSTSADSAGRTVGGAGAGSSVSRPQDPRTLTVRAAVEASLRPILPRGFQARARADVARGEVIVQVGELPPTRSCYRRSKGARGER